MIPGCYGYGKTVQQWFQVFAHVSTLHTCIDVLVLVPILFYFFLSHFSTFGVSGKMFCSDVVEGTAISNQKLKGLIMNLFYRIFVFSF